MGIDISCNEEERHSTLGGIMSDGCGKDMDEVHSSYWPAMNPIAWNWHPISELPNDDRIYAFYAPDEKIDVEIWNAQVYWRAMSPDASPMERANTELAKKITMFAEIQRPGSTYTSPPSADAMFNAGIEAAAAELLRMSRESKVPANQAQWLTAHGMVRTLKRPTDTMVMSREEVATLKAVASEYNEWIRFHDAGNGDYKDFVSRVKEGE
jgi:hypothetical protein